MFENVNKLVFFSFNDKIINNFDINNIRGMFSGWSSLKKIFFEEFKGQNITDICCDQKTPPPLLG
jgi:hypothetical protein